MFNHKHNHRYIHEHVSNWFQYQDLDNQDQSIHIYKLHISIHPDEFKKIKNNVHALLHKAMQQQLISCYKIYDVERAPPNYYGLRLQLRQKHNPFVIYLYDDFNEDYLQKIAQLCKEIEHLLRKIRPGDIIHRAECDLTLPHAPHFIFRQAFLDNAYVAAVNTKKMRRLKTEGKNSAHYKKLCALLLAPEEKISLKLKLMGIFGCLPKQDENKNLNVEHGLNKRNR